MLTGTLVITAAGFLPVGFANSGGRRIYGIDVLGAARRAHRVMVRRGDVHALSRREAPAGLRQASSRITIADEIYRYALPIAGCAGSSHGRSTTVCVVIALDRRRLRARRASACSLCQKQFFPYAERLELFFQLRLPEGSSIGASLEAAKQAEALLKEDPDAALFHHLCRPGAAAVLAGSQSAASK